MAKARAAFKGHLPAGAVSRLMAAAEQPAQLDGMAVDEFLTLFTVR
jgi:hypothetical protein